MYRKDVLERNIYMRKDEMASEERPNFAAMAREMGCDWRTAKKAYEAAASGKESGDSPKRPRAATLLGPWTATIDEKLKSPLNKGKAIYRYLKKLGYGGSYGTVKAYVRTKREQAERAAQMRFETTPGLQAQVDWKERMTLRTRSGEAITFDIFLMVLGYSRYKYFELTLDKTQPTLMGCMLRAASAFGGFTAEVLFDNMRTVADRSQDDFGHGKINSRFAGFARDCGFEPLLCRAYRPSTKGKVEDLAKLMENLRVYDGEFDDFRGLSEIAAGLMAQLNSEVSQATGEAPADRLGKEKKYLRPADAKAIAKQHIEPAITRKVSRDSLVSYEGCKYSVRPSYIGKTVEVEPKDGVLRIYYSGKIIGSHKISDKPFSYKREDYIEIMKSNAFRDMPDDVIERVCDSNLAIYDCVGG